jgi:hypothetical protein
VKFLYEEVGVGLFLISVESFMASVTRFKVRHWWLYQFLLCRLLASSLFYAVTQFWYCASS